MRYLEKRDLQQRIVQLTIVFASLAEIFGDCPKRLGLDLSPMVLRIEPGMGQEREQAAEDQAFAPIRRNACIGTLNKYDRTIFQS